MSDDLEQRLKTLETQVQLLTRIIGVEEDDEAAHPLVHQQTRLLQAVERLAPIKALLEADEVNDILINADRSVYVERLGRLEKTRVQFESDTEVFKLAEEIVARIGRHINPQRPLVDARLPDGSRVNIIAPPLSVDGTMISIRKFSKHSITLDSMAAQGNISSPLGEFLKVAGKCRLNIIVSGGTGSGKTTLLNAISQYIDPDERVVTIEDAAELKLQQPHVVRLESKPTSFGQKREEEVTIRDLVKNALRMRPDRIIVGEVRGPEAFDMMQAMNTGHEGSLTTVHANHPRDAIARLENMMNMANLGLSSAGIRAQIASAIHIIIQISRMRDGHRRVTHISEVVGIEGDIITMQELFTFQAKGEDKDGKLVGEFRWSGIMPRFLRRVAYYGESEHLAKALGIRLPGM
ncbi:MAG: CpaF family protein [Alphaproteobacteria bacterium]